ncbi:MAG TPA: hypothetical protein VKY74_12755 [Chloroflexia bacterium]|nr:hypothetical protein [Chloroflexia bacterium]
MDQSARLRMAMRAHWDVPLHRSTYLMTANLLVTLVSGVGFWILAARLFTPAEVGVANAFVGPSTFMGIVFLLGLNYGVLRFPRELEADPRLLFSAVWVSALVSAAGGAIGGGLLLLLGLLKPVAGSIPISLVLYAFLVAGSTVWTVCEAAFVGLRAPWQMLARNISFALARIVILVPFVAAGELGLLITFTAGTCLAALLSIDLLRRHLHTPWAQVRTLWHPGLKPIIGFALPNHLVNLISSVPGMVLPLIVLRLLGAEISGFFAVAWVISSVLRSVLIASSVTLLAEGARDPRTVDLHLGRSLVFLLGIVGAAALPMVLFPGVVLAPFGAAYVRANAPVLGLFALSVVPGVLSVVYVARERVHRRIRSIVVLSMAGALLNIALPFFGAQSSGYTGFALWYLAAQCVLCLAVLPAVVRALAPTRGFLQRFRPKVGAKAVEQDR